MFSLFKSKFLPKIEVDIHSHLLPAIDDGIQSLDDTFEALQIFEHHGYRKVITTPHVYQEYYPNSYEDIVSLYEKVMAKLAQEEIYIDFEVAAEYFLDDHFIEKLEKGEKLLSFGEEYILIETSFMNEPVFLRDVIFLLNAKGYRPVLAHPERYLYFQNNVDLLEEIGNMNILFQVNMYSLVGMYNKPTQKLAEWLIDHEMVNFLGTDCHDVKQLHSLKDVHQTRGYKKALKLDLLNNSL
ncbi:MAG: tyrosine-protein phosphatase [Candidatus Cyclobacteriaceae bacterium M3_2C_046]